MFMRYRGGGIGHTSTREATNRFLLDHDQLDMADGVDIDSDAEEDVHVQADVGCVSGGDNVDGGNGIGDGKEDDYCDYGYESHADDDENSEDDKDFADDSLGPEDGEGEGDETYLLGFAVL